MSNFIANARIAVYADTTPFSAELKKVVTQAERTRIRIKMVPDPVGFIRDATAQIKSIEKKLPPIKVRMVADPTGFQASVRAAALAATKNLTIPVRLSGGQVASGGGGAARGGGGVAGGAARSSRVVTAEQALAKAVEAGVIARRRINVAMDLNERRALALERTLNSLKLAETALAKANLEGNQALIQRAARLRDIASIEVERQRGVISRSETQAASRAAAAAKIEEKKQQQITEAFEEHERERAQIAERQRSIADRQASRFFANQISQEQRAAEVRKQITKQQISEDLSAQQKSDADAARAANKAASDAARVRARDLRAVARVESELERARTAGALSGQGIAGARTREAEATRQLAIAERALTNTTRAETIAKEINDEVTRKNTLTKISNSRATSQQIIQERALALESVRAAAARAAANKSVRESILANTLSLLGLRGSALAANAAFLGTSAAIITTAIAVKSTADLESQFSLFAATAGATAEEMDRVRATAIRLGRDITLPGVGASDATKALVELSKAGLSVQDSIDGTRGVLQLATAAGIDNAQATELAASALNAFALAGDQAVRVADVLANSANQSQGSIVDVGTALQQSAAVGRQAGLSLEQTVAALTLFARSGLRGSDAGTSFRTALIRLINPTVKAQEVINKLGLRLRTASGAIDLSVFQQFTDATRELSDAQRDQALAVIFGQDAIRGAAILAREGTRGLNDQIEGLQKQGTAAEIAAARMSGLTGAAENLKNQLAALGLTVGSVLVPPLTIFANGLSALVGIINDTLNGIDQLALKVKNLASSFASIPQITIGPIDTGDIDRFFAGVDERVVNLFKGDSFDEANASLAEISRRLIDVREEAQHFQESGGFVPKRLTKEGKELVARIIEIGEAIERTGNNNALSTMLKQFAAASPQIARAFKDGIITPSEKAELAASHLGSAFLRFVPKNAFIGLGAAVRSGIEDANVRVEEGIDNMGAHIRSGIEDASRAAVRGMDAMGTAMGDAFGISLASSITRATGRLAGLDREALDIEIEGGTSQDLLRNALAKERVARKKVAARERQFSRGEIAEETLRRAKEELKEIIRNREDIEDEIQREVDQAAQDRENNAREREEARNKADQAFLDSLVPGRTAVSRRLSLAQSTPGARDNIVALLGMRKRIQNEIRQVSAGVKDVETKTAELRRLSDDLFQNSLDLKAARQSRDEAIQQSLEERRTALRGFAEATDNTPLLIRLLNQEIADAREAVVKARAAKTGIEAAQIAVKTLVEQRRDMVNTAKTSLLEDAFQLAELRGNKSAMLQILDLQIAQAKLEIKQAKTLAERIKETIDLQTLINKRREILGETIEDGQKGTTAFDLLKQFSERFGEIAGNLINIDQPFAGPTGFTADIAQFLKRRQGGAAIPGRPQVHDPEGLLFGRARSQAQKQTDATTALIKALDQLTKAIQSGSGNSSTAMPNANVNAQIGRRLAESFYEARQSRAAVDAGGGI